MKDQSDRTNHFSIILGQYCGLPTERLTNFGLKLFMKAGQVQLQLHLLIGLTKVVANEDGKGRIHASVTCQKWLPKSKCPSRSHLRHRHFRRHPMS